MIALGHFISFSRHNLWCLFSITKLCEPLGNRKNLFFHGRSMNAMHFYSSQRVDITVECNLSFGLKVILASSMMLINLFLLVSVCT
jgi:hypothetical protein